MLVYMEPTLVVRLKTIGMKRRRPAFELVEEAVENWLKVAEAKEERKKP